MDKEIYDRVYNDLSSQGFLKLLGVKIDVLEECHMELSVNVTESLTQHNIYAHGGVITTLCDVASGGAALTTVGVDDNVLTSELKINFLKAAEVGTMRAIGDVIKSGKNLIVVKATAYNEKNEEIAVMLGTMFPLRSK